jgi:hypothetical protein
MNYAWTKVSNGYYTVIVVEAVRKRNKDTDNFLVT